MKYILIKEKISDSKKKELEDRLLEFKGFRAIKSSYKSSEIVFEEKEISEPLSLIKKMNLAVERIVEYR